jgi:hypothetical protein
VSGWCAAVGASTRWAGSEPLAQQLAQVAAEPRVGAASLAIAAYHEHLDERVGSVRLSVLHQRLRDEQDLRVSWASFYRYARLVKKPRSITSMLATGSIRRPSIVTGCPRS